MPLRIPGFDVVVDLRRAGLRASLARAVGLAVNSTGSAVVVVTPGQRASLPTLVDEPISTPLRGHMDENGQWVGDPPVQVFATMTGEKNQNGQEFVSVFGHPDKTRIPLLIME